MASPASWRRMIDLGAQPFVTTAHAKGLSPFRSRGVTSPQRARDRTLLGLSLPALVSSAGLREAVFAWPGIGRGLGGAVQAGTTGRSRHRDQRGLASGDLLADILAAWSIRGSALEATSCATAGGVRRRDAGTRRRVLDARALVTRGDPNTQGDRRTRYLAPLSTDGSGAVSPPGYDRSGAMLWTRLVYGGARVVGVGVLRCYSRSRSRGSRSARRILARTLGAHAARAHGLALALPRVVLLCCRCLVAAQLRRWSSWCWASRVDVASRGWYTERYARSRRGRSSKAPSPLAPAACACWHATSCRTPSPR